MKTKRIVLTAVSLSLLAAVALCAPRFAGADVSSAEGLGTWEGTGTTTELDGKSCRGSTPPPSCACTDAAQTRVPIARDRLGEVKSRLGVV